MEKNKYIVRLFLLPLIFALINLIMLAALPVMALEPGDSAYPDFSGNNPLLFIHLDGISYDLFLGSWNRDICPI